MSVAAIAVLRSLEWSAWARGPGSGPMGSGGDGRGYPSCPVCHGLKEPNREFVAEAVGHKSHCALAAALTPAPGATGQDGVNWPSDGTCRICGSAPRNPTTGLCATCSDEVPTPTIPAGMVPVPVEPTEAMIAAATWTTAYGDFTAEDAREAWREMLAAAPKQAEQQGVERQCKVCTAIVASYPEGMCCHCQEMPWPIAALNAPTGAVEKERGA